MPAEGAARHPRNPRRSNEIGPSSIKDRGRPKCTKWCRAARFGPGTELEADPLEAAHRVLLDVRLVLAEERDVGGRSVGLRGRRAGGGCGGRRPRGAWG